MVEERESFESQWAPSDVTEEDLKEMVAHGVLPAKEIIGWRPACGEALPTPDTHEVVVFSHFFYGGFSLPTSRFFRGILEFYGISLHHLNPNSIVHTVISSMPARLSWVLDRILPYSAESSS